MTCCVYSTKEMDKIEFENGKLPIAVDPEIHRQHLDQLTKELETRKRYVSISQHTSCDLLANLYYMYTLL